MVVVEQPAEPFPHFDVPPTLWRRPADNLIADPLMTALVMVVGYELRARSVKRCLPHDHHLAETFRLDRPHERWACERTNVFQLMGWSGAGSIPCSFMTLATVLRAT